jgi:hypothetical protein
MGELKVQKIAVFLNFVKNLTRLRILLGTLLLMIIPALTLPSCESTRGEQVPYVRVDEFLLLNADLANMGIGTTKLINGGWKGIVLYREADLVFQAYDRTCTLFPEHNAAVVADSSFFGVFRCPECNSTFLLMNGAEPNSGPARYPLLQYTTTIQGEILHITN